MMITIYLWLFILLVVLASIFTLIALFLIIVWIVSSISNYISVKKYIEESEKYKHCPYKIEAPEDRGDSE